MIRSPFDQEYMCIIFTYKQAYALNFSKAFVLASSTFLSFFIKNPLSLSPSLCRLYILFPPLYTYQYVFVSCMYSEC